MIVEVGSWDDNELIEEGGEEFLSSRCNWTNCSMKWLSGIGIAFEDDGKIWSGIEVNDES